MKKILYLGLCLAMCFMAFGCSPKEKEESTEWIDTDAAKISKDITSGQFVIDGVVYEFPMDLQHWLDNGWHISNNYDNVDEFTLEPGMYSNEFELFNESDDFVRVSVINTSNENAKLEECMVYSLYVSTTEVDVVLPQGLTKRNKPADIISAYGEPISRGDESGYLEALYFYETEDSWQCYVEVGAVDNNYTIDPLSNITYTILSSEDIWENFVETQGEDKACEFFFNAAMKASYKGELDDYVDCGFDTQEGAEELYQSEVEYFAYALMYYAEIDDTYVSEDVINRFCKIAEQLLAKAKWNVKSVELNAFSQGTATLEIYPLDFTYIIQDDLNNAKTEYNTKYDSVDFENIPDEEYAVMEEEYATAILDAIEKKIEQTGYMDVVELQYDVDLESNIITDDDWLEIDDTIMGITE